MEFLVTDFLGKPLWVWLLFLAIVVVLLALDLGVLHRKDKEIGAKESLITYACYVAIALVFGGYVWLSQGAEAGINFYTGYFIEQSLAMDNIFVISLVFASLGIPRAYQHRVLFWGILGVILLRAIMIGVGAALVEQFHWLLYVFAVFLVGTGIKMLFVKDEGTTMENSRILKFLRRHLRVTEGLEGKKFLVRRTVPGKSRPVLFITPLLLALLFIELVDVVFAVDSVPAIFAITTDPYIVYTSNIFAILGLRTLYFALAAMIHRFHYLKYALALVLIFIGAKIFLNDLFGKIDPLISLGTTVGILGGGMIFSLIKTRATMGTKINPLSRPND